jgi:hypothetical protein
MTFIPEDHKHYKALKIHVFWDMTRVSVGQAGITLGYFTGYSPASSLATFKLALSNYKNE